jgi:hypothetical protein
VIHLGIFEETASGQDFYPNKQRNAMERNNDLLSLQIEAVAPQINIKSFRENFIN